MKIVVSRILVCHLAAGHLSLVARPRYTSILMDHHSKCVLLFTKRSKRLSFIYWKFHGYACWICMISMFLLQAKNAVVNSEKKNVLEF